MLFLESSFHKMAESDADEFSGDKLCGDLPSDFNLTILTEETRRAIHHTVNVPESHSETDDIVYENLHLIINDVPALSGQTEISEHLCILPEYSKMLG